MYLHPVHLIILLIALLGAAMLKIAMEGRGKRKPAPAAGRAIAGDEEVAMLKKRVAVLERIAIEKETALEREIAMLREH